MIVLGIDPGTANTGYGVIRDDGVGLVTLLECGVIRTRPRDALASRLREIYDGVSEGGGVDGVPDRRGTSQASTERNRLTARAVPRIVANILRIARSP